MKVVRIILYMLLFFLVISCKEKKTSFNKDKGYSNRSVIEDESNIDDTISEIKFNWVEDTITRTGSIKKEYIYINGKSFLNQEIYLNKKKDTVKNKSSYFKIKISDTLKLGRNIGEVFLNSNHLSKDIKKKYLMVIINNQYSEKEIKKDTFIQDKDHTWFGVFAHKTGLKLIQGIILEQIVKTKKMDNDSLEAKIITDKKYFEKEVYVKDTIN